MQPILHFVIHYSFILVSLYNPIPGRQPLQQPDTMEHMGRDPSATLTANISNKRNLDNVFVSKPEGIMICLYEICAFLNSDSIFR